MEGKVLTNAHLATMNGSYGYGTISRGALAMKNGHILALGPEREILSQFSNFEIVDCGGRWITPALIDCHTHIVYGGNRAREFEMRLNGASYEEIAKAGGGIISTVSATRDASANELLKTATLRIESLIAQGVGTVEVKSGYGLDLETELKMLRTARAIETVKPVSIVTSFLGAHACPKDMSADHYIDHVLIPCLREAHKEGLVDAVDGFCESIAFTPQQIARVFDVAKELGLNIKLHAEQLTHSGGIKLAARYHALSVDHVEYANAMDVEALANSGTVAVLLPGAFYAIKETQKPPVSLFRSNHVPMAIATDWNPGSSPMGSLLLAMNMAATLFGLKPDECLRGVTVNAARALGLRDRGYLAAGLRADLAVWNITEPAELSYYIGFNPIHQRYLKGEL